MDLERGMLARLDRRLLAGLDREERFQMVRVPATLATWSTWKRYCDIAGISMGRAISAMVDHELAAVLGEPSGESGSWFEEQTQGRLAEREAASPNERSRSPNQRIGCCVGASICEIASGRLQPTQMESRHEPRRR